MIGSTGILMGLTLAMYINVDEDKKKLYKGIFLSSALAVFLTGVTEPIEYMFMFVALPLYIVYALVQGCAFAMADIVDLRVHSFGNIEFLTRTPMAIKAGIGMDVINFISKWPSLPDGDPVVGKTLGFCGAEFYFYGPCLHAYLHEMNRNCFGRGDKEYVTVGECGGLGIETAKLTTADTRQELSMVFNFDHLDNAGHMRFDEYQYDLRKAVKTILKWQVEYTNHCWPTLLFENHDNPRVTSKVDPTDTYTPEIAKLCAVLEMTLKGSPFIFQGQELGMTNTHFDSMDDVRDVESINFYNKLIAKGKKPEKALRIINGGSRDHGRTPMQWTAEPGAGFTDGTPWIGINKNAVRLNAADEAKVPDSVLNDFKRLIALRHANPALVYGEFTQLCPENKNVVCYKRTLDGNTFFVELNLTGKRQNRPYDPAGFERLYSNYHDHRDVLMPFEANVYLAEGEAKA